MHKEETDQSALYASYTCCKVPQPLQWFCVLQECVLNEVQYLLTSENSESVLFRFCLLLQDLIVWPVSQ